MVSRQKEADWAFADLFIEGSVHHQYCSSHACAQREVTAKSPSRRSTVRRRAIIHAVDAYKPVGWRMASWSVVANRLLKL